MLRWLLALLTLHLVLGMAAPAAARAAPAPQVAPVAALAAPVAVGHFSAAEAVPTNDAIRPLAEAAAGADAFGVDLPDEPALRRARAGEPLAAHFACPQAAPLEVRSSAPRRRLRPPRAA